MSGYYAWQSRIYDATRWAFLFGRNALLEGLQLRPGMTVVEIGSGTGHNLGAIVNRVGESGKVLAVDCAQPMLARCAERIRKNGWRNVELIDREYGFAPVAEASADAVFLSYSLSMIPDWERVIDCAARELKAGARIAVVDFCLGNGATAVAGFEWWMTRNHVHIKRPYIEKLTSTFHPLNCVVRKAYGGLWSYYLFLGERKLSDPSPNCDERPEGAVIDTVVLHATVLNSIEDVIAKFSDPASRVSAHYTIDRDGRLVCHVPERLRAWHAGQSRMKDGRQKVNDFSIGIELVNLNDGIDPYPAEQIVTLQRLLKAIALRHPIRHIVTHYECADPPGRKSDPAGFQESWIDGIL
jgi:SAM-dependent methyltransferase